MPADQGEDGRPRELVGIGKVELQEGASLRAREERVSKRYDDEQRVVWAGASRLTSSPAPLSMTWTTRAPHGSSVGGCDMAAAAGGASIGLRSSAPPTREPAPRWGAARLPSGEPGSTPGEPGSRPGEPGSPPRGAGQNFWVSGVKTRGSVVLCSVHRSVPTERVVGRWRPPQEPLQSSQPPSDADTCNHWACRCPGDWCEWRHTLWRDREAASLAAVGR